MATLFGWNITRSDTEKDIPSFAPVETDDGALTVAAGGSYGTYLDLEGSAKTDAELVAKYREMALQPECETAIDEIINEAIVKEGNEKVIELNLDDLRQTDRLKSIIRTEFENIIQLLDFNNSGYEIFKRWYIDGRLYYHAMIDDVNPSDGIQELRYVDPRKIRKVRELKREKRGQIYVNVSQTEYFIYNERGFKGASATGMDNQGLKIAADCVVYTTSGLLDKDGKMVLSYLHKAVKPLNQLRILEDATVIYRISRAPERRIFYVDVGNLPTNKGEQYVRNMMTKHKNRLIYDASDGTIRDDRRFMTMIEDYWLARRDGSKGTEISTLPAGQNLGEMADVEYFQKKLYRSLNVPFSRNEEGSGFNLGRSSEITRDELKFQKFINRLRLRFCRFLLECLKKQLVLKQFMNENEFESIEQQIHFVFNKDNYFAELKNVEILNQRMETLDRMHNYVGIYYSTQWIRRNVLRQTDEDIKEQDKQIAQEKPLLDKISLMQQGMTPTQAEDPQMASIEAIMGPSLDTMNPGNTKQLSLPAPDRLPKNK